MPRRSQLADEKPRRLSGVSLKQKPNKIKNLSITRLSTGFSFFVSEISRLFLLFISDENGDDPEDGDDYDAGKSYYIEHQSGRCSNYFSDTLDGNAKWLLASKADPWGESHSALGTYLNPSGNKLTWWVHAVNNSNNGTAPRFAMAANGIASIDSLYITTGGSSVEWHIPRPQLRARFEQQYHRRRWCPYDTFGQQLRSRFCHRVAR